MAIYVGAVLGGPELSGGLLSQYLREISRDLKTAEIPEEGCIDIVFHVPGSVLKPEHQGIRAGRFSRKQRIIQIQVTVPQEIVEEEDSFRPFVLNAVRESILIAEPILKRANIPFSTNSHLETIKGLT